MSGIARRLARLEVAERERLLALPHREIYELLRLDRLPDPERTELSMIIETAFDEHGRLDHRRLTSDQQTRGGMLLDTLRRKTP